MGLDSFNTTDEPDVKGVSDELKQYVSLLVDSEGTINSGAQKRDRMNLGFQINNNIQVSQSFHPRVASLVDSEGNIDVRVNKDNRYEFDHTITSSMTVGQHFKDKSPFQRFHIMLQAFCDDLDIEHKWNVFDGDGYVQYRWSVNKLDDLYVVLNSIEEYMVLKNEQAILFTEKVYPLMKENKHKTKKGFLEVMKYADKMAELRQDNGRRKYTREYFVDELGW